MKKYLFCLIYLSFFWFSVFSQQLPAHYGLDANAFSWNPALAGKFDYRSVGVAFNQAWSGFEGAPQNLQVFGETPILKRKMGLGASLEGEQSNTYNRIAVNTAVNYKIRFGYKGRRELSIGLAIKYERMYISIDNPIINDTDDPLIGLNRNVYTQLNAGVGLFLTSERKYFDRSLFFGGIALYPIIPSGISIDKSPYLPVIHGSLQAGGSIKIDQRKWYFEPVFWLDFTEALQFYPQLSLKIERDRHGWARLDIRTNNFAVNLGGMIILNSNTELRIGATAQFWYGAIRNYNGWGMGGDIVARKQLREGYY